MKEIAQELAKILIPDPPEDDGEDSKDGATRVNDTKKARNSLTGELMMAAAASPSEDPLLARLEELTAQKQDIQRQIRLITTYAREFVRPEPYRLRALADATGLSISSIRTTYDTDDVITVAARIGRKNIKGTVRPTPAPTDSDAQDFAGDQWWRLPSESANPDLSP
ncbi:hypothetical protein ITP53_32690 [Nonomuraea sp. K274]|uniref:Uncharacterized protein n=1 Tax=Nonomuraea cypriaca TaxID=1187855 RepID=A0A931F277_9ACTN|nr:hypothetical protein [Nonomuraea cypriaca]MBF8190387.1 hypothetical protein [Nonomuraea cypriaca]